VSGLVITGGLAIVNVTAGVEDPPPGEGLTTVIDAAPAVAIRAAGTVAVSCVEETNVVARGVPFQFTVAAETNFVPFTVKVNCGPPAVAQVGLIEVTVGTGLLIVITSVDVPVPRELVAVMVTGYVPAVVGVPEINPVAVLTVKPGGKLLAP